jgi:uncharacterized protein (DUF302 family)
MMRALFLLLVATCCLPAAADAPRPVTQPAESWIDVAPTRYGPMLIQQKLPPPYRDYQMSRVIPPEERKHWLELANPVVANLMQLDAREAINHFAVKFQAKPGLSFDAVVESMMLRANQVNLKYVGSNLLWKDFRAVLDDEDAPRVEVFSFCDIAVARALLKVVPEMVVFLPCRIAVMEDADKNVWILMMDWDVTWLDLAGKHAGITPELRQGAADIRRKMEDVMRAAAAGAL